MGGGMGGMGQQRAKLTCDGRNWTMSSGRLSRSNSGSHLMTHVDHGEGSVGLIPIRG